MTYEENRAAARAADLALPFLDRKGHVIRHMYKGWTEEPVEERHESVSGSSPFAITRSTSGYRVLCSPDLRTIDVDFNKGWGISRIHIAAQQKEALSNIRDWVRAHPGESWRVYRTAAGFRLIRIDSPQLPNESFDAVCKAIEGVDDLYRRLCGLQEQAAYRLRLTPKVPRIGAKYPGWSPYDWDTDGWYQGPPTAADIEGYELAAQNYKIAELIEVVGDMHVCCELQASVNYHDIATNVGTTLPMEQAAENEYIELSSLAALVAFNDVYRPEGMAPDEMWDSLDPIVQHNLRVLQGQHDKMFSVCRRLDFLYHKWEAPDPEYKDFDVLYESAKSKYQESAKLYTWIPNVSKQEGGFVTAGHWQSPEEVTYPLDARYWQLDPPTANDATPAATSSAIIRFLPSRDGQRYVTRKTLGVMQHYVANILVVLDPRHPENSGGVFVFRFGGRILEKIQDIQTPPPEFADMESVDAFDPKTGSTFKLRVCRYDGQINFDKSSFDAATPIGDDDFIADLLTRVYSLDEA